MTATIANTLTPGYSGLILRPLVGLVIGIVITACLFWIMQYLIETADRSLDHESVGTMLEFVRIERDETPEVRPHPPKAPPKPETQPPKPPMTNLENSGPTSIEIAIAPVSVIPDSGPTDPFNMAEEGDYLPIVKVSPTYPPRALNRGIEGFCVVEYTVTRSGATRDPNIVKDQCSSSLFYSASIKAASKFKYKPRIIGGEKIEVAGVQNKFTYEIVD